MHDRLGKAAPDLFDQVARGPVRAPSRPCRKHDLFGAKFEERVGNRLQWIGVADLPVGLDPRGAKTLETDGEAKAGARTGPVLVG